MKRIAIFGSTGSIGESTLNIIRENPDKFRAVTLVAGKNIEKLISQIHEFAPENVYITSKGAQRSGRAECGKRGSRRSIPCRKGKIYGYPQGH